MTLLVMVQVYRMAAIPPIVRREVERVALCRSFPADCHDENVGGVGRNEPDAAVSPYLRTFGHVRGFVSFAASCLMLLQDRVREAANTQFLTRYKIPRLSNRIAGGRTCWLMRRKIGFDALCRL